MIICNLRVLLAQNNMRAVELTRKTGISTYMMTNLVNNKAVHYPASALDAICRELDCDISDLLTYVPDKDTKKEPDGE